MIEGLGRIKATVTALEMLQQPTRVAKPAPAGKLALFRADPPTISFYRYLYNTVGEPWLWIDRRRLSDEALAEIIHDRKIEIYVLYSGGSPAGYTELDFRDPDNVEIGYFGIMPEFIGKGLGAYLLDWTVDAAWARGTKRLWVHTCDWDHPRALGNYQRAGFAPFKRYEEWSDDPRLDGTYPRDYQHHALPPLAPSQTSSAEQDDIRQ